MSDFDIKELETNNYQLLFGKSEEVVKSIPDNTFDSVITDPPYEIKLMGSKWDSTGIAFNVEFWKQVLRVSKPGAYLLCFGHTRTFHREICAIEDAGWQIADCISYNHGTGFPKGLEIARSVEKYTDDKALVDQWEGWHTTLKPAWEPVLLARKPHGDDYLEFTQIMDLIKVLGISEESIEGL